MKGQLKLLLDAVVLYSECLRGRERRCVQHTVRHSLKKHHHLHHYHYHNQIPTPPPLTLLTRLCQWLFLSSLASYFQVPRVGTLPNQWCVFSLMTHVKVINNVCAHDDELPGKKAWKCYGKFRSWRHNMRRLFYN